MSARRNWIAWNFEIGCPNCCRCCAYAEARSYAPCASPTPLADTEIRPPSRTPTNWWNPSPRGPSRALLALLVLVSEVVARQRPQRVVRGDCDRHRRVDARQLLDRDRVRQRVCAGAAVLLRDRHPHQPELGEAGDDFIGKARLSVELFGDRCDLLRCERAHRVADQLVLLPEVEVQVTRAVASSTIKRTP